MATFQEIIDEARVMLQDTDADSQRYSDVKLVAIFNRGLLELAKLRADAYFDLYDRNSLNVPTLIASGTPSSTQKELTDDFPLDEMFHSPLVDFITGMAEVVDDEFTVDGRAMSLLQRFKANVLGL